MQQMMHTMMLNAASKQGGQQNSIAGMDNLIMEQPQLRKSQTMKRVKMEDEDKLMYMRQGTGQSYEEKKEPERAAGGYNLKYAR